MKKICVYTCITGNYDSLKDINCIEKNIDYICFTNNKDLKSDVWKIKYINEDLDNLTLARKVKVLAHKYLSEYDLTIWIDGGTIILKPISEFLDKECDLENFDVIGFKHQIRDSIYQEINECVQVRKEVLENALKLEKFLLDEKYPDHNGLIESTILVRKNNKEVNKLMDMWYDMIKKYSRRDQLTFNYCLWKKPIKINLLNMAAFNNSYFSHDYHKKTNVLKDYRLYMGDSTTQFDYHNVIDGKYTLNMLKDGLKVKITKDTSRVDLILDEIGNVIKSINLNKVNDEFTYNIVSIDGNKYFYDISLISFEGHFKKNDILIFKIDIEEKNTKDLYIALNNQLNEIIYEKTDQINLLTLKIEEEKNKLKDEIKIIKNSNIELSEKLDEVYKSTSWKLTQPFRSFKNKMKGKK